MSQLVWQDHAVIIAYCAAMLLMGIWFSRRQETAEDFFLGSRRMPWFAVGVSIIASLVSSLTYLSEPGEVWNSGITHMAGKILAIPFEMAFVFLVCVPFLMRFRYTSAYEYLGERFGPGTRLLGVALFIANVVMWMGFVVLASSRALAQVSGVPLGIVVATVGIVSTVYTIMGGLRAVIWTDVAQVFILIGGGLVTIGYIALTTDTFIADWFADSQRQLSQSGVAHPMPLFSFDPTVRATVLTVALHMFVWHVCTHTGNQMTVQRYFATTDLKAALKSFVTGSLFGVGINLLLLVVGLALVSYYTSRDVGQDLGLDVTKVQQRDLVFPTFAVHRMPPGFGGAILAAMLAAAMSSIDSGINSMATVVSMEWDQRRAPAGGIPVAAGDHVGRGRWLTFLFGTFITIAAYALNFLPENLGIVAAMPRTFNAITGPLGGIFFIGMFLPRAGARAAVCGTIAGLATSVAVGYSATLGRWLREAGLIDEPWPELSFTWVMPSSLTVTLLTAVLIAAVAPRRIPVADNLVWSRGDRGGRCSAV
jgi:SSS family solute:Na+ symporter